MKWIRQYKIKQKGFNYHLFFRQRLTNLHTILHSKTDDI